LIAEKDVNAGGVASSSAASWTNWAVSGMSSLTSKIYKGKRQAPQRPPKMSVASKDATKEGYLSFIIYVNHHASIEVCMYRVGQNFTLHK